MVPIDCVKMEASCWCQTDGANDMLLDGPKTIRFCDLLGTLNAPVSKILFVKGLQ